MIVDIFRFILVLAIRIYRYFNKFLLTPLLHSVFGYVSSCRYEETCSHYAERMIKTHATIPALRKISVRILSCHSFGEKSVKRD